MLERAAARYTCDYHGKTVKVDTAIKWLEAKREFLDTEIRRFEHERTQLEGPLNVLADLVEAVLGAIYLDGGVRAARRFVREQVIDRFRSVQDLDRTAMDAKTRLNQWAQAHDLGSPRYEILATTGPDHDPTFRVAVTLGDVLSESSVLAMPIGICTWPLGSTSLTSSTEISSIGSSSAASLA